MKRKFYKQKYLLLAIAISLLHFTSIYIFAVEDLENVPVDVVYKYIDLTDKTLHREGIPQIQKDYDNNELMYSLRSVLKNIPWIRKIFIIMPNDKVRFLKPVEEISDKIVYIKDKDILSFDSSSCETFIWKLWKLKEFGCSNHIIFLNDDYFIGKPLKKTDFFYRDENSKVLPYIFYNATIAYTSKGDMNKLCNHLTEITSEYNERRHDGRLYRTQNACTYDFLFTVLNKEHLYLPENVGCTIHNAVGYNLDEIKDIHDIVDQQYKYADISLRRRVGRSKLGVLMGSFHSFYYLNKETRKINKNITSRYFDMASKYISNDYDLFCINIHGICPYKELDYIKEKIIMEESFPEPTPYERKDYDDWAEIDYNLKEQAKMELAYNQNLTIKNQRND